MGFCSHLSWDLAYSMSLSITQRKPESALSSSLQVTPVWGQLASTLEGRAAIQGDQEPTAIQQGEAQSAAPGREEPLHRPGLEPMAREQLCCEEPEGLGRQQAEHQPAAFRTCWPS